MTGVSDTLMLYINANATQATKELQRVTKGISQMSFQITKLAVPIRTAQEAMAKVWEKAFPQKQAVSFSKVLEKNLTKVSSFATNIARNPDALGALSTKKAMGIIWESAFATGKSFKVATDYLGKYNTATKKTISFSEKLRKNLNKVTNTMRHGMPSAVNTARNAMLGLGLTMLFGGMAIKRFTGTILRDVMNVYSTVSGQNSVFTNSINRVRAHLILMKFALLDAFSHTGIIQALVNAVISVANWFSKLPAWARRWIIIGLAIGFAVGAIMQFLGQVLLLGVGAVILMKWVFNINSLAEAVTLLRTKWKSLLGIVGKIALGFAIVVAAAYLIHKVWIGKMDSLKKKLVTVLIAVAAVALLIFLAVGGWIPLLIAGMALVGVFIIATWDKVKVRFEIAIVSMKIILGEFVSWALKQFARLPHAVLAKMGLGNLDKLRDKWSGVVQGYKNRKAALQKELQNQPSWWEMFKENMGFGKKKATGASGVVYDANGNPISAIANPWSNTTGRTTTGGFGATWGALSDLGMPTFGMIGMGTDANKTTNELSKQTNLLENINNTLTKQGRDIVTQTTQGLEGYGVTMPDVSALGD